MSKTKGDMLKQSMVGSLKAEIATPLAPVDRFAAADKALAERQPQGEEAPPPPPPPARKKKAPEIKPRAKVVRDGFSMPADEYEKLAAIQARLLDRRVVATKSQVVRAALRLMVKQSDDQIVKLISEVDRLRPGPEPEPK